MNWDWDKLQEKRKRQSGQKPRRDDDERDDDSFFSNDDDNDADDQHGRFSGGGGFKGSGPNLGNLGNNLKKLQGKKFFSIKKILIAVVLIWLATGIFIVDEGEQAVVLVFGKAQDELYDAGPHYRWPYPIAESLVFKTDVHRSIEVGFRTVRYPNGKISINSVESEAAMLTSDENIALVQFIVQYQINNLKDFLFNADLQLRRATDGNDIYSETVKNASIAAMREAIGSNPIDAAIFDQKVLIQTLAQDSLQSILNSYGAGITISSVKLQDVNPPEAVSAAFKDVTSAREDKNRVQNEAEAYRNRIIPQARGEAEQIINVARAYGAAVEQKAIGDSQKFLSVLEEYNKAQDITEKRLYLETMEEVLSQPGVEKIIVGSDTSKNILPLLPLVGAPGTVKGGN